ncbi:MAG: PspC domain-containing protein [Crocinitomicaceae bacterium]|nr:PspC domain-containing protein [Crocinitomicaceae bacterium]
MNKTISINIAGFAFTIEEKAFEMLNRYLESIKKNFQNESDCDEIMADIESRIAELFQEKLSDRKEVIIESDVEYITSVMGQPEDYVSEETADNFKTGEEKFTSEEEAEFVEAEEVDGKRYHGEQRKRLWRDEQGGTVGGVCSGLGWFFGIDPVLIRIGFILLTILGGSGILLYIILWIVIPEARTTAEILEMQGEPVTLDSIKDHVQGMKSNIKDNAKDTRKKVKRAVDHGVRAGSRVAESFSRFFGVLFILGGIFALFVLAIILFGDTGLLPLVGSDQIEDLQTLLGILYPDGRALLVFICIVFVTIIPIVSFIYTGVRMIFRIRHKNKTLGIATSIVWFLAVGTLVLTGIELGMNFRNEVEIDYVVPVETDSTNTLYVDVKQDDIFSNFIEYQKVWNYTELVRVQDDKVFLGYPELKIIAKNDSSNFEVMLYKESNGLYNKEAIHKAENIHYQIESSGNHLTLDPYFSVDANEKLRNQHVVIEIHVPQGKQVKFGNNIDRILVEVADDFYWHNETFVNTTWYLQKDGFRCIECKDTRRVYNRN